MAKRRPEKIEWEPYSPSQWRRLGVRKRYGKWEVVRRESWWTVQEEDVLVVADSRDAAIGFMKLLKEN